MTLRQPPRPRGVLRHPPRVVRLVYSVGFSLTGVAFMVWPSKVATAYFETVIPSYVVGVLLLLGGLLKVTAWRSRMLNVDRAGLSALVAGLGVVAVSQTLGFFFGSPFSWGRLAGAIGLWSLTLVLVARWQDVKFEIRATDEALSAARWLDAKEQRSDRFR